MAKAPESEEKHLPLFVKVERYNDIIKIIESLRSYVLSLRDAVDVMEELQKEIKNGITISQKVLDDINMTLSSLDSYFLKPQSAEDVIKAKPTITEKSVDDYVKNVYEIVERLRTQLNSINK